MYHLEGLPPACLLHGVDDELSPFSQSVQLADEMQRRGLAYEFYAYEGRKHYFSTRADDATTCAIALLPNMAQPLAWC
jgi:dipeptidyl aminopeptidase/acylaminoacyl peptidase